MDALEKLLKDAKHFAWSQTAVAPVKRHHPVHMSYANPDNWVKGELVELIYQGSEAADTLSLGLFRELIYRHGGRKLVREAGVREALKVTCITCKQEIVQGKHWLEQRVAPPPTEWPEDEVQELRQRLIGLIEEWDEGASDE